MPRKTDPHKHHRVKSKFGKRRAKRRRARINGTDDPKRASARAEQLKSNKYKREAARRRRRREESEAGFYSPQGDTHAKEEEQQ
jgi:hypothetical protein